MKGRIAWGILWLLAGIAILAGLLPGDVATGPRIGIGMALTTVGALILIMPISQYFIMRRAKPEDYEGRCPVGESCEACGAFNFHPRRECRSCSAPVNAPDQA